MMIEPLYANEHLTSTFVFSLGVGKGSHGDCVTSVDYVEYLMVVINTKLGD